MAMGRCLGAGCAGAGWSKVQPQPCRTVQVPAPRRSKATLTDATAMHGVLASDVRARSPGRCGLLAQGVHRRKTPR
jgi:hypothetical protein